jgi:hypothetical protein
MMMLLAKTLGLISKLSGLPKATEETAERLTSSAKPINP